MEISDEYGILSCIVEWQISHPEEMLPPHIIGNDLASDQRVELYNNSAENMVSISNVPKRLLPFIASVGLGKSSEYIGRLFNYHQIYFQDIESCSWNTDFSVIPSGTIRSISSVDLSIEFFRAINKLPDLTEMAEWELGNNYASIGLLFMDDEKFHLNHKFVIADEDQKAQLLRVSSWVPDKIDFFNERHLAGGNISTLIERAGGYLPDVLFGDNLYRRQKTLANDFWYAFFKDSKLSLDKNDRVIYFNNIFEEIDKHGDKLFYKGLRTLEACSVADDDILDELYDIECALGEDGKNIITDLQLLKGLADPGNVENGVTFQGYYLRFTSELFLHNVFSELLGVDQREVNLADLNAFSKIHLMNNIDFDLTNIEVSKLLIHILGAYEKKCAWFKESSMTAEGIEKTIAYLKPHLPSDLEWTVGLSDEVLRLLAKGGLRTHEKLSNQSLAEVFSHDLNL